MPAAVTQFQQSLFRNLLKVGTPCVDAMIHFKKCSENAPDKLVELNGPITVLLCCNHPTFLVTCMSVYAIDHGVGFTKVLQV